MKKTQINQIYNAGCLKTMESMPTEYMFAISKGNPRIFNPIKELTKHRGLANMKNRVQSGSLDCEKIERTKEKNRKCIFLFYWGRYFY